MATAQEVEHAIEQQLRFGEHALLSTETAVPAAAKSFFAACKAAESGGGEVDDAVEAALQQLDLIDFQADKLDGVRAMCLEQQGQDTGAHEKIERGMEGTLKKLEGLRGRLEVERVTKKRRLQYNTVAEEIASLPSSAEAKGKLASMQQGVDKRARELRRLERALQRRRRECALLLHAIQDLKRTVGQGSEGSEGEEEEEEDDDDDEEEEGDDGGDGGEEGEGGGKGESKGEGGAAARPGRGDGVGSERDGRSSAAGSSRDTPSASPPAVGERRSRPRSSGRSGSRSRDSGAGRGAAGRSRSRGEGTPEAGEVVEGSR